MTGVLETLRFGVFVVVPLMLVVLHLVEKWS